MAQEREIYEWEVSVEIAKREKDDMIYVPRQSILTIDAELTNLRAENAKLTADLRTVCRQVHSDCAEKGCTCEACVIIRRVLSEGEKP